jgi:carboxypeptidase T
MKLAKPLALALAVGFVWGLFPVHAAADENGEIVSIDKKEFLARRLERKGLDLLMEKGGRIYAVVSPGELAALFAARVRFTRETGRFFPYDQTGISADGGLNGAYHSSLELETDFRLLARDHPQLAKVVELGTSLERRKIYALKISGNVSQDESKPAVLLLGCHHAREWISVEVPFLFGKYLLENYDTDAAVRDLVDRSEVWIVPIVNTDGLEYTIHVYRYWRKNRRANADGSYGVDINRNYACEWGYDNIGSSPDPASDVFRGTAPFSEPETEAVRRLFLSRDFRAVVSYHSFSQVILYPWGYVDAPAPADAELHTIAGTMAGLIAGVRGTVYGYGRAADALYTTNGDTVDWAYAVSGIPAFTVELPPVDVDHGGFFNDEAAIDGIFRENLPAMLYLAGYAASAPAPPRARSRDRAPRLRFPFRLLPGGRIDNIR